MKKRIIILLAVLFLVPLLVNKAEARNSYLNDVNGTCGTSYSCDLCHIDPGGGGPLNAEGQAYVNSGYDSCYFCPGAAGCVVCDPSETSCTDGVDNDCDGLTDCADTDCAGDPACCDPSETSCTDGVDNDCDGLLDCADTADCAGDPACVTGGACTDYTNKGDCNADPNCVWVGKGKSGHCENAAPCPDADSDGYTDTACGGADCNDADPDVNPGAAEVCDDTVDNDCDGSTDCADGDCTGIPPCPVCDPSETSCTDGVDNDCDGSTDCADPDCTGDPDCPTGCTDADGDSYAIEGGSCGPVDCDDNDPTSHPFANEICNDGADNDCDGLVDEATANEEGLCGDGLDNDCDGDIDCDDRRDCRRDDICNNRIVPPKNTFNIMMNYELGMHCTGFEFSYCCILPPYNSILAQVVRTEKDNGKPRLLEGDPNEGLDFLGRPTVVRDLELDGNDNFKKYVMKYWHEAQPRNDGRGAPQTSTLISSVEGNSLMMWNTIFDSAAVDANGKLTYGSYNGATDVVQGDGDLTDATDNYWNAAWNHLYIYADLEGSNPNNSSLEADKIRLGVAGHVEYPENTGAALHPMGPGSTPGFDNVLTFSTDHGTVVYTQMKVLENLPVMLTSPRIWEALGLPLTPFEDSINFFGDPGAVDEDSIRPYVIMKAQLLDYATGDPVLDNGTPVIGFGTAPIDIPNCERCHALPDMAGNPDYINSAQNNKPDVAALVQGEYDFWSAYYGLGAGDSDWYSRLKGAAISILAIHDQQHGTSFTANYPVSGGPLPQKTRLGHESVVCQRCHADNVIAHVKSATSAGGWVIPPMTEAIHMNHKDNVFSDSLGRNGGCQGCHPAHRSDGSLDGYPITETGLNIYHNGDNRDAAGGCFVGRDVHSNRDKDNPEGVPTPSHLNAVGQWLVDNVVADTGPWKGLWCTNCHSQLGQELWKAEDCVDLVHGDCITNPRGEPSLAAVAAAVGVTEAQAIAWLDPKTNNDTAAIWMPDPGLCNHVATLFGAPANWRQDGNVATIEVALPGQACSTGFGAPGPDCDGDTQPDFEICGSLDGDGDFSVNILDFCTTDDCVTTAQAGLANSAAVPVPMSAATDGRDHWLSPGEPHCADCHAAPYVEQSGNINAFPPFNYPRKASLFRYTRGHQDITCQGCHESIHGLYPTTTIDTTSYAQAASMNTDGSHGPLKCGACHEANDNGVNKATAQLIYDGLEIGQNYDAAVSWMHEYTDEADPRTTICLRCHDDNSAMVSSTNGKWNNHAKQGRASRDSMDKVEILQNGHVNGDSAFEDPLATLCISCHRDKSDTIASKGCTTRWKNHLIEGRASESVWEDVSTSLTSGTCGY